MLKWCKNIEGLIETKNSASSLFLHLINVLFAGDKFDIKDFHDVVLQCGAVPLKFLEYEVNEYIKEELETLMTLESLEDWTFSLSRPHPQQQKTPPGPPTLGSEEPQRFSCIEKAAFGILHL